MVYSLTTLKWEWNLRNIQCGTEMSEDVVRLVSAAFASPSEDTRMRLEIAACLGHQFDAVTVDAMIETWNLTSKTCIMFETPKHEASWEEACSACIVNASSGPAGGIRYHFSHDKFQRFAMKLTAEESERWRLHHRIGQFLLEWFHQPETREDWMLLAAVDQLNQSIIFTTH